MAKKATQPVTPLRRLTVKGAAKKAAREEEAKVRAAARAVTLARFNALPLDHEIVVDLFAGGGGASTGIEDALGVPVDIAINHDAVALAAHERNHPNTHHIQSDIFEVKPRDATGGRPVSFLWASPDCRHFSKAKGGKPVSKKVRSLAWVVAAWANDVRPKVITMENVEEFLTWGPLHRDGPDKDKPIKSRRGEFFRKFVRRFQGLGYVVEWRVLDASQYGAPTKRKRLVIVMRCDGFAVRWPTVTHSEKGDLFTEKFHTAAECIDWSLPCPSIFERKKPLKPKTLWRVAQGIKRFVLETGDPYIVNIDNHSSGFSARRIGEPLSTVVTENRHALVSPHLVKVNHGGERSDRSESLEQPLSTVTAARRGHALVVPVLQQSGYGEREGQKARVLNLQEPLGTIMATGQKHALVTAFIASHFGGEVGTAATRPLRTITSRDHNGLAAATLVKLRGDCAGTGVDEPLPTLTAGGSHVAEVMVFLTTYYGTDSGQSVRKPMRTITTKDRLGLVTVKGVDYQIVDIGLRMLQPDELKRAQFGRFAAGYDLSPAKTGTAKVRLIGNSVSPEMASAVVSANRPAPRLLKAVANG